MRVQVICSIQISPSASTITLYKFVLRLILLRNFVLFNRPRIIARHIELRCRWRHSKISPREIIRYHFPIFLFILPFLPSPPPSLSFRCFLSMRGRKSSDNPNRSAYRWRLRTFSRKSLISTLANREWQDEEARGLSPKWWEDREGCRMGKEGGGIPNTAIYSPRESPRLSTRSGLYARFRGQNLRNVRGWNLSIRFFNCKKDPPGPGGSGSPPRKPALGTLSPPTGLDSFERAGDESFESRTSDAFRMGIFRNCQVYV